MTTSSTPRSAALHSVVIAMMAFFTVVDLFATQAVLPLLARAYGVSPAAMSVAVDRYGWAACIARVGQALLVAMVLGRRFDNQLRGMANPARALSTVHGEPITLEGSKA